MRRRMIDYDVDCRASPHESDTISAGRRRGTRRIVVNARRQSRRRRPSRARGSYVQRRIQKFGVARLRCFGRRQCR